MLGYWTPAGAGAAHRGRAMTQGPSGGGPNAVDRANSQP